MTTAAVSSTKQRMARAITQFCKGYLYNCREDWVTIDVAVDVVEGETTAEDTEDSVLRSSAEDKVVVMKEFVIKVDDVFLALAIKSSLVQTTPVYLKSTIKSSIM